MQECWRIREAYEASQEQLCAEREKNEQMEEKLRAICHRVRTQDRLHFVD